MAAAASAVGDPTTGGGSWGAGDVCEASAPAGSPGWEFGDSGRGTSVCIGPDGAASAIPSILSATGLRAWLRSACSNDTSSLSDGSSNEAKQVRTVLGERLRPGGERPACAQPLVSL